MRILYINEDINEDINEGKKKKSNFFEKRLFSKKKKIYINA